MDMRRFILRPEDACVLVIDMQEKLFRAMEVESRNLVLKNTDILVETAHAFSIPLIITEQYPKGIGPTLEELKKKTPDETPIEKTHFNCLGEEAIATRIDDSGRNTIILCGMETHICVLATAMHLLEQGRNVVIASNAVCSRRKHDWETALAAMASAGAVIYPVETIVFMLIGKAGTEQFKALSPLVK